MARNTAREIYVNKFLQPNPFLVGAAAELPTVRRDDYLQAKLVFPDEAPDSNAAAWGDGRGACCVLSSGGKDSLLSYGLLNEVGVETHPIFVNESGRHWFTALNAYRRHEGNRPEHRPGLDRLRPGLQLDAAAAAVRASGLRQGPGGHLPGAAVDGGGIPVRRPCP